MQYEVSSRSSAFFPLFLSILIAVCGASIFPQTFADKALGVSIPKSSSIQVDGKMGEVEWKDSLSQDLKNGGQIKLNHNGEFLQIGLQGGKAGISHIYLSDGSKIYVLHASAALGMAVYQRESGVWQPIQKFKWELRDVPATENAVALQNHLKTNGWVANIDKNGSVTDREFQIAMKFRDGNIFRMAVVYVSNPTSPQFFPQTISDDTLRRELVFGTELRDLRFKEDQWISLMLK